MKLFIRIIRVATQSSHASFVKNFFNNFEILGEKLLPTRVILSQDLNTAR